jgi:hypothetical protein
MFCRNTWAVKQSWVNQKFTNLSLQLAQIMRTINILLFPGLPLFRLDYKYTNLSLKLAQIMRTINILLFPGLPLFRLDYKYFKPESTTGADYANHQHSALPWSATVQVRI